MFADIWVRSFRSWAGSETAQANICSPYRKLGLGRDAALFHPTSPPNLSKPAIKPQSQSQNLSSLLLTSFTNPTQLTTRLEYSPAGFPTIPVTDLRREKIPSPAFCPKGVFSARCSCLCCPVGNFRRATGSSGSSCCCRSQCSPDDLVVPVTLCTPRCNVKISP